MDSSRRNSRASNLHIPLPINASDRGGNNGGFLSQYGSFGAHSAAAVEDFDDQRSHGPGSLSSSLNLVGGFRRPSFTFGPARPAFVPSAPLPTDVDTLNAPEKFNMEQEQRALLRDNNIVPAGTSPGRDCGFPSSSSRLAFLDPMPSDETTALIGHTDADYQWEAAVEAGVIETSYKREITTIISYSLPLYITFLLQYSLTISSIFSAGNLGKDQLAGVSVACMTAVITGYAPYQGES